MIEAVTPRVILVSHTDNTMLPAKAARFCTSSRGIEEIMESSSGDEVVLANALDYGHKSVLEHFSVTFAVEGISRVTEVQLVRHRLASYSIKSGRYTRVGESFKVAIPKTLQTLQQSVEAQSGIYLELAYAEELMDLCHQFYLKAVEAGVPPEDARYILPQATATQLLITMNARELLHFFSVRCCTCAQWEIRDMSWQMLKLCQELQPAIFGGAGPVCFERGHCIERNCCGLREKKQ